MQPRQKVMVDGNQAAAHVAYLANEVIAIYPITPSSPMGEWADQWAVEGRPNAWGTVPHIAEMQSEGGAAGAVHGALQTGSLTTTFTASQGLLLMIPNMYKIAGELTPAVFHVAARTVATHALSIFGDHSDVMACRATGWGMLCSGSVQETMDFALISTAASLEARIPFMHYFDGFRTSHEIMRIEQLTAEDVRTMLALEHVEAHRRRALDPNRPALRGTAQNPDVFFQAREACNGYYDRCPAIVEAAMARFAELTGRQYRLFDYIGAPDAERVIIMMGSGAETAHETVDALNAAGQKVGLIKVRLYRPFSAKHLLAVLPESTRSIAVLDRTKEPGADGEPLYKDVQNALIEAYTEKTLKTQHLPRVIGGRYGLSSKEFTPTMVKCVFDELAVEQPKNHFTVGINDDVTHRSLDFEPTWTTDDPDVFNGVFFGLGSDGTVGANKNSIKIIGDVTERFAQGYFVYDSKKSGSVTVSHLRFGPREIRSTYQIDRANFVGCHQWLFIERYDVMGRAAHGATVLINSPYGPDDTWGRIPRSVQQEMIDKQIRLFVIDALSVARECGMGGRINTIMQTCFFGISNIMPRDEAIARIKQSIEKSYSAKGAEIVQKNCAAVDASIANLHEIKLPAFADGARSMPLPIAGDAPEFVREVLGSMIAGRGDELPVSALPVDGTFPTATAKWEKRSIAAEIPVWDPEVCIQCGKCAFVCPHASIRLKAYDGAALNGAPETFKSVKARGKEFDAMMMTVQVAAEDCTGCGICVEACPAKNKSEARLKAINMAPQAPLRETEAQCYSFFDSLPEVDRNLLKVDSVKGSQYIDPLFEFSGACSGCGETPYVKLVSQLFGDRTIVANATGCSSIYGGNLPTTPWAVDRNGRGPAWCNSLFEDNAEFGLGYRLSIDKQTEQAREWLISLKTEVGEGLVTDILDTAQANAAEIENQRARIVELRTKLATLNNPVAAQLAAAADTFVNKSVWIMGGDGWAYDIGFGGLDHVLASGKNVNILVLDTEVYSNTGGQCSKSTPRAAVAKFAAAGKPLGKKDLPSMAMSYGHVYVATVAMGASDNQTIRAFIEAESYDGPSLIIAYSHCIAHGINMRAGLDLQKRAVDSGHFPLLRFDPRRGERPLQLDSKAPRLPFKEFAYRQNRFKMLTKSQPQRAAQLMRDSQQDARERFEHYERMSKQQILEAEPVKEPATV